MRTLKNHLISDIVFGVWLTIGLFLDEKYHTVHKHEIFWTTPHLIIDSGILCFVLRFAWIFLQVRHAKRQYSKSVLAFGLIPFFLGLIGDLMLHDVLDVQDESILTRPTHMLILIGFAIFLLGLDNGEKKEQIQ